MIKVEIDQGSGFCFGVINAIKQAESELASGTKIWSLGDIVHNNQEVKRLKNLGLEAVDHQQLKDFKGSKVLFRAHGEPPATYQFAQENKIEIVDATCPVVLRLQKKILKQFEAIDSTKSQILIYGKKGHAEVVGLLGQTQEKAIVIEKDEDLENIDFTKDTYLFSQTTMHLEDYRQLIKEIESRIPQGVGFHFVDSICRQVSNRMPNIGNFAAKHDLIIFVAGKKSSNGKVLYSECKKRNTNTHFIESPEEIDPSWMKNINSVGICGATSTPKWLMEEVAKIVENIPNN
ncbi:4-hydroxy-3-methylbut-2-enyl diphosphate reductase [Bacteroidales bacterium]|nr:4-hydroxy-3-methylbut-2-enyl diphosphate reductase [Bacteroidales bacterium]